jgi:GR25 family glycosyltransferase involved in LPS biosynthesis
MIDIFNIPLYYISFNKNNNLENRCKELGFTNVNHFYAIDGTKFTYKYLIDNNLVSPRSFNDLMDKRHEHSGIPSLGAIGCTISHHKLWELCFQNNFPYITIIEEDVQLTKNISLEQQKNISKILEKPKSFFISSDITKSRGGVTKFFGTHFCIISKEACLELFKKTFPISVQTDFYIAHMDTINKIDLGGFKLFSTKDINRKSLIQDICIKCLLPNGKKFYFIAFFVLLLIIVFLIIFYKKYKKCKKTKCRRR